MPVLRWMFMGQAISTYHATDATWSKQIALITQCARIGKPNRPGILEIITNRPEGENFGLADEEEAEQGQTKNKKWLYGVPHDKLQKLLKEKVGRVNLHDPKPSSWRWTLLNERSGQGFTSILTCGW
ncbi:hypothetical protein WISP_64860 [Willisornis vidua]|uniref:Uncharacterized protein n=1 Tax=Willisornis vidua TaxID=1566151 RepID=A0ABQ9DEG7_9PASS|nr:hypothetical protein WISP_64860 [Willisornis vidua]